MGGLVVEFSICAMSGEETGLPIGRLLPIDMRCCLVNLQSVPIVRLLNEADVHVEVGLY